MIPQSYPNKQSKSHHYSQNALLFFLFLCFIGINVISAQSELADKRFSSQEDRELEKIAPNKVKTRTAIIYQKGSFAKASSGEGTISEYIKYDENGYKTEHTRFRQGKSVDTKWIYENDAEGNITKLSGIDHTGNTVYVRNSKYDNNNNEIVRTEYKAEQGNTTKIKFKYNSMNMLLKAITYDVDGNQIWMVKCTYDGSKLVKQESYDKTGESVSVRKFNHNKAGLIIQEIDATAGEADSALLESFKYNNQGRVLKRETGSCCQVYTYNTNGDVISDILYNILKKRQHKFEMQYNSRGLLAKRIRYSPKDKVVYEIEYEYEYY